MHNTKTNVFVEEAPTASSTTSESEEAETAESDDFCRVIILDMHSTETNIFVGEAPATTNESEDVETVETDEAKTATWTTTDESENDEMVPMVDDGISAQSMVPADDNDDEREESIMITNETPDSNAIPFSERQNVKQMKLVDTPETQKNEYPRIKQSPSNNAAVFSPESMPHTGAATCESNHVHDISFETQPYQYKSVDTDSGESIGLLVNLLRKRITPRLASTPRETKSGCPPGDMLVEYIYEHDIYNQVFNSSMQELHSPAVQNLQSNIVDWTVEEIYKRNLAADVTNHVRLTRMVDVSKEYNNNPVVRYYVSIVVRKTLIPVFRRILTLVFDKLQKEYFAASNTEIDWNNMVSIPIQ
ncbi:unnamed protein product [Rotaria sp. Silwood2]|nr:unnamed protein product [Rotaria sp. Silwood2]CAF2521321.1 unnamed protein product [Rotaria sp. Silwood2]CAF2953863.1 unnamed protein product [Rotaria sp. Silwood2]CAF3871201.1 unnamed protein product [Rotaria sp. Silwood2]CAF4290483.1 unnamed protein product [Rotaria sp. Silwood2]